MKRWDENIASRALVFVDEKLPVNAIRMHLISLSILVSASPSPRSKESCLQASVAASMKSLLSLEYPPNGS